MNWHFKLIFAVVFLGLTGMGCRKDSAPTGGNSTPTAAQPQTKAPATNSASERPAEPPSHQGAATGEPAEVKSEAQPVSTSPAHAAPANNAPDATSSADDPEVSIIEEPNKEGGLRLRRQVKMGPEGKPINHGKVLEYMETGELWKESHWFDGKKHGAYTEWYKNGQVSQLGEFDQGTMIKTWTWFYDTGVKQREGSFDGDNQRHGTWTYWDPEGKKLREEHWDHGTKR